MTFNKDRFATTGLPADSGSRSVQSINQDTIVLTVSGTATRIADLLETAGFHTRWGYNTIEGACEHVDAIVFLSPAADLNLRTKSADTTHGVRTIPSGQDTYIPAVRLFGKFLDSGTPGSYTVEVLHANPTLFD